MIFVRNDDTENSIDFKNILSKTKILFETLSQSRAIITNEYEFAMAMVGMNVPVVFIANERPYESGKNIHFEKVKCF